MDLLVFWGICLFCRLQSCCFIHLSCISQNSYVSIQDGDKCQLSFFAFSAVLVSFVFNEAFFIETVMHL